MNRLLIVLWLSCLLLSCQKQASETQKGAEQAVIDENKEVVCFVYHRFGDDRYPSTNTSTSDFEAHLNYLKTNGFQVITLSQAIDYLKSDQSPKKTAVITVDDGFKSFYENGLPLLTKYDLTATLFINTKTVGSSDYMNWNEIKESSKSGIEIGNHTHSHSYFLNLPENDRYTQFKNEINLSQQLIEEHTGIVPETFAYPYGELDPQMKTIAKEMGFKAAAAQNSGVIYGASDLYQLPRFPMSESYASINQFVSKANMKALKIENKNPESFVLADGESTPSLRLTFKGDSLILDQLQCFIQGSECDKTLMKNGDITEVTLTASTPINSRRRTLYTITVPDKHGNWHWFSHLWINPKLQ